MRIGDCCKGAITGQAERDCETFQAAILSGRLSIEPAKDAGLKFLIWVAPIWRIAADIRPPVGTFPKGQ